MSLAVGGACSNAPADADGVTVEVVWQGGGDEPSEYAGFAVSIVPLVRSPGRDAEGPPMWRVDPDAEPVTGVTDGDGRARLGVSPAFPYRARASKTMPRTSEQCHWSGSTSMHQGGAAVVIEVDESCA